MQSPPNQPRIQIKVSDFGPIAEATVDLRPSAVFVGPSNTGKSYRAILIYALHRFFHGLRQRRASDLEFHKRCISLRFILDAISDEHRSRRFTIIDEAHSSQGGRVADAMNRSLGSSVPNEGDRDPFEDQINRLVERHRQLTMPATLPSQLPPRTRPCRCLTRRCHRERVSNTDPCTVTS